MVSRMTSGCLGDERGATILLTGPPGAGKTRTALLWSLQRRRPTFALDWDPIASAIEVSDDLRGHAALDVDSRYQLAAKVAAAHAATITGSGVDCVIVGARAPRGTALPAGWEHTWDDLDQLEPYTVVLLPRMEVALERNRADRSRRGAFAVSDDHVRGGYAFGWEQWESQPRAFVVDTSDMTLQQVVAELEQLHIPSGATIDE